MRNLRTVPPLATGLALLSGALLSIAGWVFAKGHLATALWISLAPGITVELAFAVIRRSNRAAGHRSPPIRTRVTQEAIALVAGALMAAAGYAAADWNRLLLVPLVLAGGATIQIALTLSPDTGVHRGRYSAHMEGDFVVFLIGMRINNPFKIHKWLPVALAMPKMLRVLDEHPELGCLGYRLWPASRTTVMVQYWRDFESLDRFARDASLPHLEPWRRFNKYVGNSSDVGVWHETFRVRRGEYEAIYGNMPVFGLAAASVHVPVQAMGESAAARIGEPIGAEPAVPPA